ncbi:ATP-dependent zinc metalloprotease FtsH [Candidatus Portiera aleyrodidarum]|uniref:ATP-dependent zinc metalloprotease FtsH n=1 Tax=Candidatus Portiera aleyrodidarum TaxID=91844 RepID=A0A8D9NC65_9GAMM|nr:ATP-dependent zinc metalloprotease FtsH [Candidatus Portiera aleyrodidarum]CEI58556.1 ATP-dependent zinc metalloprotease FtsH [Candidatus Portiera aleyrodidarum]
MAKNLINWLIIVAILLTFFNNIGIDSHTQILSYSQFVQELHKNKIRNIIIDGYFINGQHKDGSIFKTIRPTIEDPSLIDDLLNHNVSIEGREPNKTSIWSKLLISSFPILIIIAVLLFFMRQMQINVGGKGGPIIFGKSKAKVILKDQIKITFRDVAGCDEAKSEVEDLVDFLKNIKKFKKLGGKIPKGVLMIGPPGTGKTLLAKAIAGEAKVPFFTISGSEFVEMFVGVGASRVRDMFIQAKKQSPCIIFIDEIDAVGRTRGSSLGGGGHDEREQTLNQLLVEMDGFESNKGTIVIAATNRPDVLDKALLRPGRFDRKVNVTLPDIVGRENILNLHLRKIPLSDDVEPKIIALGTPGCSGAELANIVNEAAILAAKRKLNLVSMNELEKAKDKLIMGNEIRSMVMSEKEKRNTAYHEAGHAIIGLLIPEHDPIYKVTIIPRAQALGVTMFLPKIDRYCYSRKQLISKICSLFGGRVAEEITQGVNGVTTGASNDIKCATELAHQMVYKWGFSSEMGPIMYDEYKLNNQINNKKFLISIKTYEKLDKEIIKLIEECYLISYSIIVNNIEKLDLMAEALFHYETINFKQIKKIMQGKFPKKYI